MVCVFFIVVFTNNYNIEYDYGLDKIANSDSWIGISGETYLIEQYVSYCIHR